MIVAKGSFTWGRGWFNGKVNGGEVNLCSTGVHAYFGGFVEAFSVQIHDVPVEGAVQIVQDVFGQWNMVHCATLYSFTGTAAACLSELRRQIRCPVFYVEVLDDN